MSLGLNYIVSEISDIGGRSNQQDYFGKVRTQHGSLFVVADGMGGRNGGSIASEIAVKIVLNEFVSQKSVDILDSIRHSLHLANRIILQRGQEDENLIGMGTTIAILFLNDIFAKTFHIGDSRVYQFRDEDIVFCTTDHSKVSELVMNGIINPEKLEFTMNLIF
ncbi:MAG: serine/threonine-protein phosphatase [Saprospiraceae bacterium]|nr:serine/threonine-protein phosphatase [Saprospiraceae bacterium]